MLVLVLVLVFTPDMSIRGHCVDALAVFFVQVDRAVE